MSTAAETADDADRGRRSAVAWGVLLTAAVVVYELTTQPALAGLTLALKAGLRDFRTAFWLRLRDPKPTRGTAHFWLYVGTGMGLTCLAALLILLTLVAICIVVRPRQVVAEVARGAGLALLASCVVALLAGTWAAVRALPGGHRLWVNVGVHDERRAGHWPPRPHGRNAFPQLLGFIACGAIFVLLPAAYAAAAFAFPGAVARPGRGNGLSLVAFMVVWWGFVFLVLGSWNRLQRRLTALTPADAWPAPPPPPDPADPYHDRWAAG